MKCGQKTCEKEATSQMFWPGNPPLPVCESCKLKALGIAAAMGFYLHVEMLQNHAPQEKDSSL